MAAAAALALDGAKVTLLERRPFLGGRAYSYDHPALGETIDSQHIVLGCCTNILDLIDQAGAAGTIRWYDDLCFLEPGGRESWMRRSPLPAPLHQTLSFLRAPMLSLRDKASIAAGLTRFLRGYPASDTESFATWLQRTGQTPGAIRHFWEPVVVGALNDTFDRCSTKYAAQVFYESFLRSPQGGQLGIPAKPLSEFFTPVKQMLECAGVNLRTNTSVDAISRTPEGQWQLRLGGDQITTNAVILAGDMRGMNHLLSSLEDPAPPSPHARTPIHRSPHHHHPSLVRPRNYRSRPRRPPRHPRPVALPQITHPPLARRARQLPRTRHQRLLARTETPPRRDPCLRPSRTRALLPPGPISRPHEKRSIKGSPCDFLRSTGVG